MRRFALLLLLAACKAKPEAGTADPVLAAITRNVDACRAEDLEAYVATLDVTPEQQAQVRAELGDKFRRFDLAYQLAYTKVVERQADRARVRFLLVTTRVGGEQFHDNATTGDWIVRLVNGQWKIAATENARVIDL